MAESKFAAMKRFPKVFWIAQTFEMMERGAYYSMMPIIAYHAIYNVGLPEWLGALIAAFMYPFQYGLPIFTGALAEKVGYKRQMIFAFIVLTIAYFFLASAYNTYTMIFAMMSVGIGIGSYKPLISATVAKCTSSEDRNLAYSVYYLVVNIAAFAFPLVFFGMEMAGYLDKSDYALVFIAGGVMVAVNIVTAAFIFEEVPRSGKVKTVGDAIKNIKLAVNDKKFVVMVFLIGGFWALYSTMLYALPIIIFGFRWNPWYLTPMLLGIFNPLTIIALGMPLGKFTEKVESLRVLLGGLVVYLCGLVVIGLFIQSWSMIVIGIIIASIGEFLIAPGYLSFISKLAPKENISAYIGCNFISYMIGLLGGTIVFGLIVAHVAVTLERPHFFYGILISFGFILLFLFTLYYQTWGQDIIKRARRIREEEEGTPYLDEAEALSKAQKEPILFRIFDNKVILVVSLILVPVTLIGTYSIGTYNYIGPAKEGVEEGIVWEDDFTLMSIDFEDSGAQQENSDDAIDFVIPAPNVVSATFTLTWQDEPAASNRQTNEPDEFTLEVSPPNNASTESSSSDAGSITISIEFEPQTTEYYNGTGNYEVTISLGNCGDHEPTVFDPLGLRTTPDNGNTWSISVKFEYYTKAE